MDKTEYRAVPSKYGSISEFRVLRGEADQWLKHLIQEPAKWIVGGTDVLEKTAEITASTKMLSVGWSVFFPVSLLESVVAGTGLGKNVLWHLPTAWKELKAIRKARENMDPEVMALMNDLAEAGIDLEAPSAFGGPVGPVDRLIERVTENARLRFGDSVARRTKTFSRVAVGRSMSDQFFTWFADVKIWAADRMLKETAAQTGVTIDRGTGEGRSNRREILRHIEPIITMAYGGLNQHSLAWATPQFVQFSNLLWFAFAWTKAAWDVAGGGLLTGRFMGNAMTQESMDFVFKKNWPAMIALVLLAAPSMLQLAVWAAAGGGGPDDEPLPLMNEIGRRSYVDITPLVRQMPWYKGDPTGKRRFYMRFGKQSWEVLDGWLTEPVAQFLRKLSQPARWVLEQATGRSPGSDWNLEFQGQGLRGWLSTDQEGINRFMTSRVGYTVSKFLPMSFVQGIKDPETWAISAVAPISKGMTMGRATEELVKIFNTYAADESWAAFRGNKAAKAKLAALAPAIVKALEANGYEAGKAVDAARGVVLGKLYSRFFKAMEAKDTRAMDRVARSILRVGGSVAGLRRSLTNKGKVYGKEVNPEDVKAMEESMLEAMKVAFGG